MIFNQNNLKSSVKANKSSYFRVKLKRIKFELYTEPNLTWTLTDLDLNRPELDSKSPSKS